MTSAVQLAKEQQAQLRVVHVVDEVSFNWPDVGDFEEYIAVFRVSGRKLLDKAEANARRGCRGGNEIAEGVARIAGKPVLLIRAH